MAREQRVDDLFLRLLDRWNEHGRPVSDKLNANSYAPARFAEEPEAKADRIGKRELPTAWAGFSARTRFTTRPTGNPREGGPDWSEDERHRSRHRYGTAPPKGGTG
jgi:hypothetical protein